MLAKELSNYTYAIRLASRHPVKINGSDELLVIDLLLPADVDRAVKGSEVAYLTIGLRYSTKVWKEKWPVIMQNVIAACLKHQCRFVFFDNLYLYDGSDLSDIQEDHPVNPPSKKGAVRAAIVATVWEAVSTRGLIALVARCADFYSPGIKGTSLLTETVFTPLRSGKTANWMVADTFRHAFTYTPDAAKATALLSNTAGAYGQTWHLPRRGVRLPVKNGSKPLQKSSALNHDTA